MKNSIIFIICILSPLVVGGVSGFLTAGNINTWFVYLEKPSFNPPGYLFGPVWTTLYLLMGVSLYLIVRNGKANKWQLIIFAVQLILNFLWSFIFFKYHLLGWAFIEISILWLSILTMIIVFYKTSKTAALLNLPYLLWVTFASILNYSIFQLN